MVLARSWRRGGGGASSDSSAAEAFGVRSEVEVKFDTEAFRGAWYEATVTGVLPFRRGFDVVLATVFSDTDPSRPIQGTVRCSDVRPRPSPLSTGGCYDLHQLVEVYDHGGWWAGVVADVYSGNPPAMYTVCFPRCRLVAVFAPVQMRPRLEWRNGLWFIASAGDQAGEMFAPGMAVELSGDRENYGAVWFAGTVLKVIERNIFLVEYKQPKEDGSLNFLRRILDAQYLRPIPPPVPNGKVFGLLDEIEIYHNGGWMAGVVFQVVDGLKYVVELMHGKEEEIEVNHANTRIRYHWSNGRWTCNTKCCGRPFLDGKKPQQCVSVSSALWGDAEKTSKANLKRGMGDVSRNHDFFEHREGPSPHGKTPDLLIPVSPSSADDTDQPDKMMLKCMMGEGPSSCDFSENREGPSPYGRTSDLLITFSPSTNSVAEQPDELSLKCLIGEGPSSDNLSEGCGLPSLDGKKPDLLTSVSPSSQGDAKRTNKMSLKCKMEEGSSNDDLSERGEGPSPNGSTPDLLVSVSPSSPGDTEQTDKMSLKSKKEGGPSSDDLSGFHKQPSLDSNTPNLCILDSPLSPVDAEETNKKGLKYKMGEEPSSDDFSEFHGQPYLSGKTLDIIASPSRPSSSSTDTKQENKMSLKRKMGEQPTSQGEEEELQPRKEIKKGQSEQLSVEIYPKTPVVELEVPRHQSAPTVSSAKTLPFVKNSILWRAIEGMEVFQIMPQEPSFRQLEQISTTELREGMAVGLMVSFANLVSSVRKLHILDPRSTLEEKLKALIPLEENGFDVQRLRSRIQELLEIQNTLKQFENKNNIMEEKISRRENEMERASTLKYVLDQIIAEVEQEVARVHEKSEFVDVQMMSCGSEIAKLQEDVQATKQAHLFAKKRFDTILDSPW